MAVAAPSAGGSRLLRADSRARLTQAHARARRRGPASVALSVAGALWSALTASKVLGRMSPALQDARWLMFYPCTLMYGSFALLGVY